MKKLVLIILALAMLPLVWGWEATRSVSENQVTLTVDTTGGTGIYTLKETVYVSLAITTTPKGCGLVGKVLTCDFEDGDSPVVYQTTGTGKVSGTITGGYPATKVVIAGDTVIPKTVGSSSDILPPPAEETIGQVIDKTLTETERTQKSWSIGLVSKIAKALKDWFATG